MFHFYKSKNFVIHNIYAFGIWVKVFLAASGGSSQHGMLWNTGHLQRHDGTEI